VIAGGGDSRGIARGLAREHGNDLALRYHGRRDPVIWI
jgi:hypothetical protein